MTVLNDIEELKKKGIDKVMVEGAWVPIDDAVVMLQKSDEKPNETPDDKPKDKPVNPSGEFYTSLTKSIEKLTEAVVANGTEVKTIGDRVAEIEVKLEKGDDSSDDDSDDDDKDDDKKAPKDLEKAIKVELEKALKALPGVTVETPDSGSGDMPPGTSIATEKVFHDFAKSGVLPSEREIAERLGLV